MGENIFPELDFKSLTPMVKQYFSIKEKHKDKLLLFRLGDFYELFGDDAYEASKALNLVLTSRNELPMCGFPAHSSKTYIQKLVKSGYKVAICEQLEDPSLAKGIVKRGVTQIITPGMITETEFLESKINNYIMSIYKANNYLVAVLGDVLSAKILIEKINFSENDVYSAKKELKEQIIKYSPSEVLMEESLLETDVIKEIFSNVKNITLTSYPGWFFDQEICIDLFKEYSKKSDLSVTLGKYEEVAVGALLRYFEENLLIKDFKIGEISVIDNRKYMEIDEFSIRNLELVQNLLDGSKKYTLLEVLDDTITPMGGRLIRNYLLNPSIEIDTIRERLEKVEFFYNNQSLAKSIAEMLREVSDVERIATRISLKRAIPKELVMLKNSLKAFRRMVSLLMEYFSRFNVVPPDGIDLIVDLIEKSINEDPPSNFENGGVIRTGFNGTLDELRNIVFETRNYISRIQERERLKTGIQSLKVGYNKVMGFYIEVSKSNLHLVPKDYERKQTLVNAERFTTSELKEIEYKVLTSSEKMVALEKEIFDTILMKISEYFSVLRKVSDIISEVDVFSCLARVAIDNNYIKPEVYEGEEIIIKEGRHPVVEKYLPKGEFIPNDTHLDNTENRIIILTGPNMAGKSTYLRQNALIAIMAHMGSFVPAKYCKIGIIDKIFTRIGASDYLALGQSTFLVEMIEVSNILRNSTPRSLIVMDEVGRGTSTYDGLSIAWAIIDYIAKNPHKYGKTLFATHYHELTSLGEKNGIKNYTMAVREYKNEVIFLKKVINGVADKSYGIFVAKLAGLPEEIIKKSNEILLELEKSEKAIREHIEKDIKSKGIISKSIIQPSLFGPIEIPENLKEIVNYLKSVDPANTTPIEALKILDYLCSLAKGLDS